MVPHHIHSAAAQVTHWGSQMPLLLQDGPGEGGILPTQAGSAASTRPLLYNAAAGRNSNGWKHSNRAVGGAGNSMWMLIALAVVVVGTSSPKGGVVGAAGIKP